MIPDAELTAVGVRCWLIGMMDRLEASLSSVRHATAWRVLAGLATAAELSRRGVPYRVFERGPSLGTSWVNAYDSLRLHTGRHMSTLPRHGYPRGTPLFPTRDQFVAYLRDYAAHASLKVESDSDVTSVRPEGEGWVALVNIERLAAARRSWRLESCRNR